MHREHRASEGACLRATWVKVGADQIDRGIDFYKIDPARPRGTGRFLQWQPASRPSIRCGVASATFDSVEAMERNKDQLDRIRATGSRKHTQRCSTSATSSWRLHTCVCPRWSDRLQVPIPPHIARARSAP